MPELFEKRTAMLPQTVRDRGHPACRLLRRPEELFDDAPRIDGSRLRQMQIDRPMLRVGALVGTLL